MLAQSIQRITCEEPAAGMPIRPAWARFSTAGEFRPTSFSPGDGLVPGRYRVSIEAWDKPRKWGPKRYLNRSCRRNIIRRKPAAWKWKSPRGKARSLIAWDVPKP